MKPVTLALARPFFRYSSYRQAYVLRGIGRHIGPVLRVRPRPGSDSQADVPLDPDPQGLTPTDRREAA